MYQKVHHFFFLVLAITLMGGCKKGSQQPNSAASADEIVLSVNNGTAVHYNQSTYNPATEWNGLYKVGFSRTYYTTPTRLSQQYNFIEVDMYDSDLLSQPLPYKVKTMSYIMSFWVPQNWGSFDFTNSGNKTNGHLNITITSVKDQRMKGDFDGVVYNHYNFSHNQPDSLAVNGSFDILLPQHVNY